MESERYQLRDITPKEMSCVVGACPRIYKTNRNTYVIIGKFVNPEDAGLEKKVGEGESLIEIPKGLLPGRRE